MIVQHDSTTVEPLLSTMWPFVCIVVVIVGLALADFMLEDTDAVGKLLLLVLAPAAGAGLLALAGVTLRRLFAQRQELQRSIERRARSASSARCRTSESASRPRRCCSRKRSARR